MIHVYCGDGKGKTTAAVGLAVRMASGGKRVSVIQFMKDGKSGEVLMLRKLGITVKHCDKSYGFYKSMSETDKAEITACHNNNLREAISAADDIDMFVLDEIFAAVNYGLVDMDLVKTIVENCGDTELVLTGRKPEGYFLNKADYVSEIKKIKHPFDKGVSAREGIEY